MDINITSQVFSYANLAAFPGTGAAKTLYVAADTNYIYYWDGAAYQSLGAAGAAWGSITGTLSNQTDLQSALDGLSSDIGNTTIELLNHTLNTNNPHSVSAEQIGALTASSTDTLTNKRITNRVNSTTSSSSYTPNIDSYDAAKITALAADITLNAPSGTPTSMQSYLLRIKDDGTARLLTFNAIYRFSSDQPAPTTTTLGKTMYLFMVYNSDDTKWDVAWRDNY